MKDKNLPNDYNSLSLEELTTEANKMIEELENQGILPKIPCQPIGYRGAKKLMEKLSGTKVPEDWKGGLIGVDYTIGGEFTTDCQDCVVR